MEESFLSEHVVQALLLPSQPDEVMISGVGLATTAVTKSRVSFALQSPSSPDFRINVSALVLPRSTTLLPRQRLGTH